VSCKHKPGDRSCSSYGTRQDDTPDASNWNIVRVKEVGKNLVLMVKYPNCAACAYEGQKVMVFVGQGAVDALHWKRIDPHFRDKPVKKEDAPSPSARFPASDAGWADALMWAEHLQVKPKP
jgi:hypothetical protein